MPLQENARKKYCDLICRKKYNQELRTLIDEQAKDIRGVLKRNRRILKKLYEQIKQEPFVDKNSLEELGFQFKYVTHTQIIKGHTACYCYDYGYFLSEDGRYLIIGVDER